MKKLMYYCLVCFILIALSCKSQNDFDKLINYEELENWEKAIPTNEHYLPSLYVLTLKHKEEKVDFRCEKVIMGSMSMRSWIIAG